MFINHSSKELNLKLIYVGLPYSGKADNLRFIYDRTDPESKGKMISIDSPTEKTIFFDFVPKGLGEIRGYRVRIHLYSLDGKEEYEASTSLLLKNADGVVFVADSQEARLEANLQALDTVKQALIDQGREWAAVPKVFQINKHSWTSALGPDVMRSQLEASIAILADTKDGSGVFETLKAAVKELLLGIKDGRVTEWTQTEEERTSGDQMASRVQLVSHYCDFFGETSAELGPWRARDDSPLIYISLHAPTQERPYFTYATFGLSTEPQAPEGPNSRIELLAYSPVESERAARTLVEIALLIARASEDDAPFQLFDTVQLGEEHFSLTKPDEPPSFQQFPDVIFLKVQPALPWA